MPPDRTPIAKTKPEAATRQGNGRAVLPGIDGRSWGARRYRELAADLTEHLGGEPSIPQQAIIRRAVQIQVWCEACEAAFVRGEDFDIALFSTATNSLRRLLVDLGLERRPKDVTPVPGLHEYIAQKTPAADG